MNRQYYYLVAGLPDLFFEDKKIPVTLEGFRSYLSEHLTDKELNLLKIQFWQFDNQNLINRLENKNVPFNTSGNLSVEEMDELFAAVKDDTLYNNAPEYLHKVIRAFKDDSPIIEGKSWELQLSELFYEFATSSENTFINEWFKYERNLNNVLTAIHCRNNSLEISKQLVGQNEITEKLSKSGARDFGLSDEIKQIDKIFRATEETDLLEQEKKIDLLKWELLDDESFFYYFSIEKLFVFTIKLSLVERWINLDKPTGEQLFNQLLSDLESSYSFPTEFSLK